MVTPAHNAPFRHPADEWVDTGIALVKSDVHRTTWMVDVGPMQVGIYMGVVIAGPLPICKRAIERMIEDDAHETQWKLTLAEVWELWIVPFVD